MKTGALNRRIEIQRATDVAEDAGGFVRTWAPLATVWANARPTGGKEALVAGTLGASQGWRVEMRFRSDVTTEDRLVMGGEVLNIRSVVDVDGRREAIVLLCDTERASG